MDQLENEMRTALGLGIKKKIRTTDAARPDRLKVRMSVRSGGPAFGVEYIASTPFETEAIIEAKRSLPAGCEFWCLLSVEQF